MTPTATTPPAARRRPAATARAARAAGHRAPLQRPRASQTPRRVSGPARATRPPALPVAVGASIRRLDLAARIRALADLALLDRIIRGRAWIPLLGVLLAGIVAMQVEVLKLNAGIGATLERGSALQISNEQLRIQVAQLSADQRIETVAAHMGMVMPDPSAIRFVGGHPSGTAARAAANIHIPDAGGFASALAASEPPSAAAAAAPATTTAAAAAPGTTTAGAGTTSAATTAGSP